jgi:hypothetical protein
MKAFFLHSRAMEIKKGKYGGKRAFFSQLKKSLNHFNKKRERSFDI